MAWERVPSREGDLRRHFTAGGYPEELARLMQFWHNEDEALIAFLGREYCGGRDSDPLRWHISVRGNFEIPDWGQMAEAAHAIRPGVHFVIMVPPKSLWMNVHDRVLHLWETNDPALVEEVKANARGDRPTR